MRTLFHIRHQLPVIATLGKTAVHASLQPVRRLLSPRAASPSATGPLTAVRRSVAPIPRGLINDYLVWCGTEPDRYAGTVPPHLFPHWSLPVLGQSLTGLPYPLLSVLNAGCRMEVLAPIPAGEPLLVEAYVAKIDDDGKRALIRQRSTTSTGDGRVLLVADVNALVPLAKGRSGGTKDRPMAPEQAEIIDRRILSRNAGLEYACLAGDFNPIHWLPPYAKAAGFRSTILHGFATMALAYESLVGARSPNDPWALRVLDVRFTRPLVLPQEVGWYLSGSSLAVADSPGEPAYLTGVFEAD